MKHLSTRRQFIVTAAVFAAAIASVPAFAQGADPTAFLNQFANKMVDIVNGPGDLAAKQRALQPVIDDNVDVDAIARFCLARFWRTATPDQQQKYVAIFHQVLMKNITSHLGEYQGVSFTTGGTYPQGNATVVKTVVTRPNAPPANIGWVISNASGSPKVVDVVAEGTSLRVQTRDDYTSYLQRHGNDMNALIAALQRQVNGGG